MNLCGVVLGKVILFRWLPKEIATNLKKNLQIQWAFFDILLLNKENFYNLTATYFSLQNSINFPANFQ